MSSLTQILGLDISFLITKLPQIDTKYVPRSTDPAKRVLFWRNRKWIIKQNHPSQVPEVQGNPAVPQQRPEVFEGLRTSDRRARQVRVCLPSLPLGSMKSLKQASNLL